MEHLFQIALSVYHAKIQYLIDIFFQVIRYIKHKLALILFYLKNHLVYIVIEACTSNWLVRRRYWPKR
jgi:hypothetical protein